MNKPTAPLLHHFSTTPESTGKRNTNYRVSSLSDGLRPSECTDCTEHPLTPVSIALSPPPYAGLCNSTAPPGHVSWQSDEIEMTNALFICAINVVDATNALMVFEEGRDTSLKFYLIMGMASVCILSASHSRRIVGYDRSTVLLMTNRSHLRT